MCAKLLVLSGDSKGSSFEIAANKRVRVGSTNNCDVKIGIRADAPPKIGTIDNGEDGWSISVEAGHPWIIDNQIVENNCLIRLKENSLIRLSVNGPDLRFRMSMVGDAVKDVQPQGNRIQSAATPPPALAPQINPQNTDPSHWETPEPSTEWDPESRSAEYETGPSFGLPLILLVIGSCIAAIASVYYLFFV